MGLDYAVRAKAQLGDEALTLEEVKLRHVERVLKAAEGSVSGAAIVLGIRRQSLQRIMKRLRALRSESR